MVTGFVQHHVHVPDYNIQFYQSPRLPDVDSAYRLVIRNESQNNTGWLRLDAVHVGVSPSSNITTTNQNVESPSRTTSETVASTALPTTITTGIVGASSNSTASTVWSSTSTTGGDQATGFITNLVDTSPTSIPPKSIGDNLKQPSKVWIIATGTLGGVVLLLAISFLLYWILYKRSGRSQKTDPQSKQSIMAPFQDTTHFPSF